MISTRRLPPNDHYPVPGMSHPFRPDAARFGGRDDTLHPDERRVGTESGFMGRDVLAGDQPYMASPGMFHRLHEGR
jgi:hypothetical protein